MIAPIEEIGYLIISDGILKAVHDNKPLNNEIRAAWLKFVQYDFGSPGEKPKEIGQIVGRYNTSNGDILIVTESNKEYTTIMLCEEY